MYYLGIDGGGTKTQLALADEKGRILRQLCFGSTNPIDIGMGAALTRLKEGIVQLLGDVSPHKVSVFAGIAGGITGDNRARVRVFLDALGFAHADNGSDAQNIVAAGLGTKDGIITVMGTGSVTFVQRDGELSRLGGYGYLFGEGGSGYTLGRDAVRAALVAEEGSGKSTLLHALLLKQLKTPTVLAALSMLYAGGKRQIASYAPPVFTAYEQGDTVATEILRSNMTRVAQTLCTARAKLRSDIPARVVLSGGLTARADILLPMIQAQLDDKIMYDIHVLSQDPVMGALILAGMPTKEN